MKLKDPFFQMVVQSLFGALLGLVAGFVFGWIMYGVGSLFYYTDEQFRMGVYYTAPFLGMGAGTLVGAIMGAMISIRKKQ